MDVRALLPKDISDDSTLAELAALSDREIEPILPDLLVYLQDFNWPVAPGLVPVIRKHPGLSEPYILDILRGTDDLWKYWILSELMRGWPSRPCPELLDEIARIARRPTVGERGEEADRAARGYLAAVSRAREAEEPVKGLEQVFASERIRFTKVSELLVPDYLIMVNDTEHVNRYIGGYIGGSREPYTEEQEIEWVRRTLREEALVFSMTERAGGAFIGNIELMDPAGGAAELGIALTAGKQDRGYGTEAVRATVRYGLERLGLRRITLRTRPDNVRAIHVYRKCGFRECGMRDGQVCMEITE